MSAWEERLARLADEQRDTERARANPHHGPSRRAWMDSVVNEDGWGIVWGGPVINHFEGGVSGTGFASNPVPPENAVQFTDQVFVTHAVNRRVQVYVTSKGSWRHVLDGSPCEHGPDIPLGEWTWVELPFTCRDSRMIRAGTDHGPFWVDGLDL